MRFKALIVTLLLCVAMVIPVEAKTLGVVWWNDLDKSPTMTQENQEYIREEVRRLYKGQWTVVFPQNEFDEKGSMSCNQFCQENGLDFIIALDSVTGHVEHIKFRTNRRGNYDLKDVTVSLVAKGADQGKYRHNYGVGATSKNRVGSLDLAVKDAFQRDIHFVLDHFEKKLCPDTYEEEKSSVWQEEL